MPLGDLVMLGRLLFYLPSSYRIITILVIGICLVDNAGSHALQLHYFCVWINKSRISADIGKHHAKDQVLFGTEQNHWYVLIVEPLV